MLHFGENVMSDKKIKFPLKLKAALLLISFSVVICTVAVVLCIATFSNTNEGIFKMHARDLAYTAAKAIDADALKITADNVLGTLHTIPEDELVTSDDWGSPEFDAYLERYSWITGTPEYSEVYNVLADIRDTDLSALSSIYTIVYDTSFSEPLAVYIADASLEDQCLPGVIDLFNPEDDFDAIYDPSGGIEPYITNTEAYGWLVVAGAPVYDSNSDFAAFVTADLSMNDIKKNEHIFFFVIAGVLVSVTAVIFLIFLFAVEKTVIHPINRLSDVAQRYVREAGSDHRVTFDSLKVDRNDEIGNLTEAMKQMETDLRVYIKDLTAMTAEKERLGAELNVASKIQSDMMPTDFPERPECSLFASMTPAKEVGGDFYDFFMTDDDNMCLVMADVSGKGVPASLFMVIAKSIIRNIMMLDKSMLEMAELVNKLICENDRSGYFITAWIGKLTLSTGELVYINAGHEYPALKRHNGEFELIVSDNCPPLAVDENMTFVERRMTLSKGDSLFLYTDGVPEAKSGNGERFGTDRMLGSLNVYTERSPERLVNDIGQDIRKFMGNADVFDDITMLCLNYYGKQ